MWKHVLYFVINRNNEIEYLSTWLWNISILTWRKINIQLRDFPFNPILVFVQSNRIQKFRRFPTKVMKTKVVLNTKLYRQVRHIPHTRGHIRSKLFRCKKCTEYWHMWPLCIFFCIQSYNRRTPKKRVTKALKHTKNYLFFVQHAK